MDKGSRAEAFERGRPARRVDEIGKRRLDRRLACLERVAELVGPPALPFLGLGAQVLAVAASTMGSTRLLSWLICALIARSPARPERGFAAMSHLAWRTCSSWPMPVARPVTTCRGTDLGRENVEGIDCDAAGKSQLVFQHQRGRRRRADAELKH